MSKEVKKSNKNKREQYLLPVILFTFMTVLWLLVTKVVHYLHCGYEIPGQIGDSFGVVNSLFSGLAFCGIVYTIYQQRRDFRRELTAVQRQRRESGFFALLSIHLDIVKNMKIKNEDDQVDEGIECFTYFIKDIQALFLHIPEFNNTNKERYAATFKDAYLKDVPTFEPYLHSLLSLYKYVVSNALAPKAHKRYIDIIRGYVTIRERVFLFYYLTLTSEADGNREFKLMESELNLIRNLSEYQLANGELGKKVSAHKGFLPAYEQMYPLVSKVKINGKDSLRDVT